MLYNILGDTHGRDYWEKLVREDCINVFTGDYFSPYDNIPFKKQVDVFTGILSYKEKHPQTVMLRGNHDIGGYVLRPYNRDGKNTIEVNLILKEHEGELQTAYSIENKALVTHAGVSFIWYDKYKNMRPSKRVVDCSYDDPEEIVHPYTHEIVKVSNPVKFSDCKTPEEAHMRFYDHYYPQYASGNKEPSDKQFLKWNNKLWQFDAETGKFDEFYITPDELAKYINGLWNSGKYNTFSFDSNASSMDTYGMDERHGPLWIRPEALRHVNAFEYTDYWQIVGHTWVSYPYIDYNMHIAYTDCLQYNVASLIYDSETNDFKINKPN